MCLWFVRVFLFWWWFVCVCVVAWFSFWLRDAFGGGFPAGCVGFWVFVFWWFCGFVLWCCLALWCWFGIWFLVVLCWLWCGVDLSGSGLVSMVGFWRCFLVLAYFPLLLLGCLCFVCLTAFSGLGFDSGCGWGGVFLMVWFLVSACSGVMGGVDIWWCNLGFGVRVYLLGLIPCGVGII